MCRVLIVILLLVAWTSNSSAQPKPSTAPLKSGDDPHERRATRERAVARLDSEAARAFVEALYGDEACAAVFACSLPVARRLAEFHAAGNLDKLPKTRQVLRVIGQHGDEVAVFVLEHPRELEEPNNLEAFLDSPLEIALHLKPLEVAAGEVRARRQYVPPPARNNDAWHALGIVGGAAAILALFAWRKHRAAAA